MTPSTLIQIAAAIIWDQEGRVLLVRKRDTLFFMQPGGKLDAGETALATLERELREELGCSLQRADFMGVFSAPAANEPLHRSSGAAFSCRHRREHRAGRGNRGSNLGSAVATWQPAPGASYARPRASTCTLAGPRFGVPIFLPLILTRTMQADRVFAASSLPRQLQSLG